MSGGNARGPEVDEMSATEWRAPSKERRTQMNADALTLDIDTIDTDAPLFDPAAFALGDE